LPHSSLSIDGIFHYLPVKHEFFEKILSLGCGIIVISSVLLEIEN
jgi:hypothetical protein